MRLSTTRGIVSLPAIRSQIWAVLAYSILAATALFFANISPTPLYGQSYFAGLRGTITDTSGAAVANAKVTMVDQATGIPRETVSGADGLYVFNQVVPATYMVRVEVSGFKKLEHHDVLIGTQEFVTLDLKLELGQVTQTVEVKATVPQIETANASEGEILTSNQLQTLPDFGRNVFTFSRIAQNVVPAGHGTSVAMQTQSAVALTSINGGMLWQNEFLIDGINDTAWFGEPLIVPSLEAVAEAKVQTNTYDAEVGRTGGGVWNVTLKSGTNDIHGTLYGSIRRNAMDANIFFNNAHPGGAIKLSPIPDNTWAGSLGGPVYIPHLYDGRNRTFFFFSEEGYDDSTASATTYYVPTQAERQGNFTLTVAKGGAPLVIYDPLTTVQNGSTYTRQTFTSEYGSNAIPSSRINTIGFNIASYYPTPTSTPAYYGAADITASSTAESRARQEIGKLDEDFTKWWRASVSFQKQVSVAPGADYFGGPAAPDQWRLNRTADATAVHSIFTISPTTVLAVRYGFNRFPNYFFDVSQLEGFNPATLGFPTSYTSQMMGFRFPIVSCKTILAGDSLSNGNGSLNNYYSNNLSAILSKTVGRNSFKGGFDFRRMAVKGYNFGQEAGNWAFNGVFTQSSPTSPLPGTGADLADMLLGYPSSGDTLIAAQLTDYTNYYGIYGQDDIRVTRKLSVNLGLRWERENGLQEVQNRLYTAFNESEANPLAASAGVTANGVVEFAGQGGAPTFVGSPTPNKFGPRIGAAYQIDDKTVIRGGWGLIWAPQESPGSPLAPAGYASDTAYVASTNNNATPANSLSNPFPNGLLPLVGTSQGALTGVGQAVTIWNPTSRSPRIQQFSVDVERELPGRIVFSVGYLGNRGTHLTGTDAGLDMNQNVLNPSQFSQGSALTAQVANPFYGNGGVGVVGSAKVQASQLLLPFPTFSGVTFQSTDRNHSHYDSLVIKAEKRMSNGVSFLSTITWARSYDLASVGNVLVSGPSGLQDPFNVGAEYAASSWQPPLTWGFLTIYELPFGKGKHFLSNNRALDYLVGGWQWNGVAYYRTGFPLGIVQATNYNSAFGYAAQRPNATGVSPHMPGAMESNMNDYINPLAFSTAPQFTFGNVGRTIPMRGPGQANWDMSIHKTVPITERFKAQFRAEALNVFNTPMFDGPNTSYGSASFGRITSQDNISRELQICLRFMW
jgi:hypothetical protein